MTDVPTTNPADETPADDEVKKKPNKKGWREKFSRILTALTNCLKEPFITKLTARGYDATKINGLITLHTEVEQLDENQAAAYKLQYETTETVEKKAATRRAVYMKLRKLAKVAFDGQDATIRGLQLNKTLKGGITELIATAKRLYVPATNDPTIQAALATTGITTEEIAAEMTGLAELESLNTQQELVKKQAQDATEKREAAMADLEKAYWSFHRVAQVALEDETQFLELLSVG